MSPFIIAVIVLLLLLVGGYNSLIRKRNQVDHAFASIDAMLKKRFDLIPNLVAAVKNYTQYEQKTLENLVNLRSKAINGGLSPNESIALDNSFAQAARGLVVLSENYPDLKASDNFNQLQRAINESEEQIAAARRNYNATVTAFNNAVQTFPSNLLAMFFGFQSRTVLTIPEEQRENVDIDQLFR